MASWLSPGQLASWLPLGQSASASSRTYQSPYFRPQLPNQSRTCISDRIIPQKILNDSLASSSHPISKHTFSRFYLPSFHWERWKLKGHLNCWKWVEHILVNELMTRRSDFTSVQCKIIHGYNNKLRGKMWILLGHPQSGHFDIKQKNKSASMLSILSRLKLFLYRNRF